MDSSYIKLHESFKRNWRQKKPTKSFLIIIFIFNSRGKETIDFSWNKKLPLVRMEVFREINQLILDPVCFMTRNMKRSLIKATNLEVLAQE